MDRNQQEKIIEKDIKQILKDMHNGEGLIVPLNKLMDIAKGIKYKDEQKFVYMLQGMIQEKMQGNPILPEDRGYINGHNDAVNENNFSIQIAISAIMDLEEEKEDDR